MVGENDVEQLILMTDNLWGLEDKALDLEVDPSIEHKLNNFANSRMDIGRKSFE